MTPDASTARRCLCGDLVGWIGCGRSGAGEAAVVGGEASFGLDSCVVLSSFVAAGPPVEGLVPPAVAVGDPDGGSDGSGTTTGSVGIARFARVGSTVSARIKAVASARALHESALRERSPVH